MNNNNNIQLCASCDRCRSRKTKCDGKRPCSNCKTRYLRANNTKLATSASSSGGGATTGNGGNGGFDV